MTAIEQAVIEVLREHQKNARRVDQSEWLYEDLVIGHAKVTTGARRRTVRRTIARVVDDGIVDRADDSTRFAPARKFSLHEQRTMARHDQ